MKQVLGACLISGGGLADLRGGLASAGPPRGYGPASIDVHNYNSSITKLYNVHK